MSVPGKKPVCDVPVRGRAGKVSSFKRRQVYERDNRRCLYCGLQLRIGLSSDYIKGEPVPDDLATVDHVIPNGDSCLENLAISCGPCNTDKADYLPLRHPVTRELVEGVTWANIWMRAYRRELVEHMIPVTTPRDLVNRILRK